MGRLGMRTAWMWLAALLVTLGAAGLGYAKLDAAAYKEVLRKLDEALKAANPAGMAAALRDLAQDDSDRAVKVACDALERMPESDEVAAGIADFVKALTDEKALKALRTAALKEKDWRVRVTLVDALAEARTGELETLAKATEDNEPRVAVGAVRQLAKMRTLAATDAIIACMERLDAKSQQTFLWQDCQNALTRILGVRLDMGGDYKSFLSSRRDAFVEGTGLPGTTEAGSGGGGSGGTVTLFGQPIVCSKVVIILDRSGSMVLADPYPRGYKGEGTRSRTEEDEMQGGLKDPKRKRIFRAKEELLKVAEGLAGSKAKVNIIAYSTDIAMWKEEGLHDLSSANLTSMKAFIEGLEAEGVTATDLALEYAFDRVPDADCFYLISDGFATRDGENKTPTSEILEVVRTRNRLRKVQINTLGFENHSGNPKDGADREMMESISGMTGGTYTPIP